MPKKICLDWFKQLDDWKLFKESCIKNERHWKQLYGFENEIDREIIQDKAHYVMLNPNQLYESEDEKTDSIVNVPIEVYENSNNQSNSLSASKQIYFCKYCDTAFLDAISLQNHERNDHNKNFPFKCNFCQFEEKSISIIVSHIKEIHNSTKAYICFQCNKAYAKRSDRKKHSRIHTGIKPYVCDICSKAFGRTANLTKHKKVHLGLFKNYLCTQTGCTKSFSNKYDFQRHIEIHAKQPLPLPPSQPTTESVFESQFNYQPKFYTENSASINDSKDL